VTLTPPAMLTGATPTVRLRQHREGRWERMPSELARAALEEHAGRLHRHRRQRKRRRAPRLPRIGRTVSGYAEDLFCARVVGLEVVVGDRPVCEAGAGDRADRAALDEVDGAEAPEVGGEVNGAAAHALAEHHVIARLRFVLWGLAEALRLSLGIVGERVLIEIGQL